MFEYTRFDVEIVRRLDSVALTWPERHEAVTDSGLGGNRCYQDLRGFTWAEAKRVYRYEADLISRLEKTSDPESEYHSIEDELYEDPDGIYGLDIGVASTVAALSAARYLPFTSCNGGAYGGGRHHEWHPLVAFFGRPQMAALLLECAEQSGAGISSRPSGDILVYATDVRDMRGFADAVIQRSSQFRGLRFSAGRRKGGNNKAAVQLKLF